MKMNSTHSCLCVIRSVKANPVFFDIGQEINQLIMLRVQLGCLGDRSVPGLIEH